MRETELFNIPSRAKPQASPIWRVTIDGDGTHGTIETRDRWGAVFAGWIRYTDVRDGAIEYDFGMHIPVYIERRLISMVERRLSNDKV